MTTSTRNLTLNRTSNGSGPTASKSKNLRCFSGNLPSRQLPKVVVERAKSATYESTPRDSVLDENDATKKTFAKAGQLVCKINTMFRGTPDILISDNTEEWDKEGFDYFDYSEEETDTIEQKCSWKTETNDQVTVYQKICHELGVTPCKAFACQMESPTANISYKRLTANDIKAMSISLVNNTYITDLNLADNDFGERGTICIGETLKENVFITSLDISGNKIGAKGFKCLKEALMVNRGVTKLNIARNKLDLNCANDLRSLLQSNDNIEDLDLSENKLDEDCGVIIATALAANLTLKRLDLSYNHLRRAGASAIIRAISTNVGLEELNLSWNGLAEEGCRSFGKHFSKNHTLLTLDISNNRIGFRHLAHFLKGLKENDTLKHLKIGSNPFVTDGAIAILKTVEVSTMTALQTIDLKDIPITAEFLELSGKIRKSRELKVIHGNPNKNAIEHIYRQPELPNFDPILLLFEYMRQENIRLIDLFRLLDKDNDNEISQEELKQGFKRMNIELTDLQITRFIQTIDVDNSKTIDISEMKKGKKLATTRRLICNEEGREAMAEVIANIKDLVKKAREEKMKKKLEERMELRLKQRPGSRPNSEDLVSKSADYIGRRTESSNSRVKSKLTK